MIALEAPAIPRSGASRRAARFFWIELILGTAASIASNITHAVLNAGGHAVLIAAAVAVVPPIVLLASTHSVSLLVRIRGAGPTYWFALAMTIGLAVCAFALSFDALWALATSTGVRRELAWLWPLAVDVSIAHATLCLLAVTTNSRSNPAKIPDSHPKDRDQPNLPPSAPPTKPKHNGHKLNAPTVELQPLHDPNGYDWTDVAETLVREGRTQQDPVVVAKIITLNQNGMTPFAIAGELRLHRDTVNRVLNAAREFLGDAVPI